MHLSIEECRYAFATARPPSVGLAKIPFYKHKIPMKRIVSSGLICTRHLNLFPIDVCRIVESVLLHISAAVNESPPVQDVRYNLTCAANLFRVSSTLF